MDETKTPGHVGYAAKDWSSAVESDFRRSFWHFNYSFHPLSATATTATGGHHYLTNHYERPAAVSQ